MTKKVLSVALSLAMVVSMAACGSSKETPAKTETSVSAETETSVENKTEASVEASVETSTETSAETPAQADEGRVKVPNYLFTDHSDKIPSTAAIEYAKNITVGWNLGNTFDAVDGSQGLNYETYWQSAKTTPELMQALKDAGINTIRIPVSWHNHVDSDNVIDAAWMARVKEVVDYCIDRDMYVILNTHHDISKFFIYPSNEYRDQSNKYLKDVWTQISEVFKDYNDKLMFESMNETRLVGTSVEWWLDPNSKDIQEAVDCINDYNKTFVDTVRKSGGNNESRFLVIPGYSTSPDGVLYTGFKMPVDEYNEDPHMIITVHAYSPYSFALESPGTKEWSGKDMNNTTELNSMMMKLYSNYVKQGVPVIIDEFGSVDKDNLEARVDHAAYFVGLAKSYGMTCVWWDNHNMTSSGEKFTIINRKTYEFTFPEIVEAMTKSAK